MGSKAIVTLADSNYFKLLLELIDSIKNCNESKSVSICVLDAGLTDDQSRLIKDKVFSIKKAKWDIEVPTRKVAGKEWLKSQVSRAFLPDYFPEFEKYLWIDCDAWVNSWDAIELYFEACKNGKLGITQTIGAGYKVLTRVQWVIGKLALIKSQNYKHAKKSGFSESTARKIAFAPHLNIGVFCLEVDAPHWVMWQKNLKKALSSGKIWGSEQIAMNITIYSDKLDVEILPAYCNWTLIEALRFDKKQNTFVEPYLPNHEIGIIHLAGKNNDNIRKNKN